MRLFLKLSNYLLHPIWMPLLGSILYFYLSPRYFSTALINTQLIAIGIMTVLIPLIFFFMLKNLGIARSIFLSTANERRLPLLFFILLVILLMRVILSRFDIPELYYFFAGILMASIANLILVLFGQKISLHMVGVAGVLMFVIGLSIHYTKNYLFLIALLLVVNGITASSRLDIKAHTKTEIAVGFFVGLVPQLILLPLWL